MKDTLKPMIPYAITHAAVYYLLAVICQIVGNGYFWYAAMIFILPIFTFALCLVYTMNNGPSWYLLALTAVVIVPMALIFFNPSTLTYIFWYGIVNLLAQKIGKAIRNAKIKAAINVFAKSEA